MIQNYRRHALCSVLLIVMTVASAVAQTGTRGTRGRLQRESEAQAREREREHSDDNAEETRSRLEELLRQYPPSLSQVVRLDPSLLANENYMAPYPALWAFLNDHGEIAHNPA